MASAHLYSALATSVWHSTNFCAFSFFNKSGLLRTLFLKDCTLASLIWCVACGVFLCVVPDRGTDADSSISSMFDTQSAVSGRRHSTKYVLSNSSVLA
ncbi:hypothetical protein AVEN_196967-1 [Araneus ventricosus]|uniref:Uncharacterized protein n=1 Tax=Araneus ventricosus TaxID=182803 RepID=A0A4Y2UX28_ARAVE|nr:hypothetical protein AVEN_196967-1 [Araneus ventricosus]